MAVYNIQLPENASKKSLEQVTAYLYRLNEQLTYMFNNMTPEENYSNEAYVKYIQEGEKVTSIEVSLGKVSASVQQNTIDIRWYPRSTCQKKQSRSRHRRSSWKVL